MTSRRGGRTVVLGVDSLDLLLVQRWAAQGLLPFLDSLLRHGPLVRLSALSRVLQGALWPSMLSGQTPGQHGTFYLTQLTNGTYNLDHVSADRAAIDPYYRLLDDHGVRCAIVDVPNDRPLPGFKGLHVIDWLTEFQFWRFTAQPPEREQEIAAQLGLLHPAGGYGPTVATRDGHRELRRKLENSVRWKASLTRELLRRDDLDHIFVVFAEAHKAGHHLWKYMDPRHPEHVAAGDYLKEALPAIYRLLDRELARLAAQLTPRDNLIVFSDHGMQANYRGDQFIGPLLRRLGLNGSSTASGLDGSPAPAARARGKLTDARAAVRGLVNGLMPDVLYSHLRERFGSAAQVDWGQVQVFQLPTDRNSYLRVNLRGREPQGTVAAGDYKRVLDLLDKEFRSLINIGTGRPAVEDVFCLHELYPGPRVNELPDMVVLWSSEAPINEIESPRLGRLRVPVVEDRSGNHRPEGFILARGAGIRSGAQHLRGDVLQVPATLLALHGISRPPHYERGPLAGLLAEPAKAASQVA